MRRLLHKLFRRHHFEPFYLVTKGPETTVNGDPDTYDPYGIETWYVGYACSCGESGFSVPL